MNSNPKYWQVSSGSSQRSYANIFLEFGVFAVNHDWRNTGGYHKYLQQAKKRDVLVLKKGVSKIHAIGIVQDDELSQAPFYFNFDGWELSYFKNIEWYVPEKPIDAKGMGLAEGTIQRTHKTKIQELANNALNNWKKFEKTREIDRKIISVKDDDIINRLINEGLKISQSEVLATTFNQVRKLAKYYLSNFDCKNVNEDQVRSFLVIPFLLALGWSEQQLFLEYKIGKKKADIVCFDKPCHRTDKKAQILVEVKKLSEGLNNAIDQAFFYAKNLGNVKTICVTNGFCYQIYDTDFSDNPKKPFAYINILQPTDKFPLNKETKGAIEALVKLIKN